MNILSLEASDRVSMAKMFIQAAKARGEECNIYSYEHNSHVSIKIVSRVIPGKEWSDINIKEDLQHVIRHYSIDIVIPFTEAAVDVASELRLVCAEDVFIPTSTSEQLVRLKEVVLTEPVNPDKEYAVDCYASVHSGKILTIVPRKIVEKSGNEVTRTETVFCPEAFDLAKEAIANHKLSGPITVNVVHDHDTDRYLIKNISSRIGDGAECAVFAGVDLPAMIMADAKGEECEFVCYRPNTEIVRYRLDVPFYN